MKNIITSISLIAVTLSSCSKSGSSGGGGTTTLSSDEKKFLGKWNLTEQVDTVNQIYKGSSTPGYPVRNVANYTNHYIEFKDTREYALTKNNKNDHDALFNYGSSRIEQGWRLEDSRIVAVYTYDVINITTSNLILRRVTVDGESGGVYNYQAIYYYYSK